MLSVLLIVICVAIWTIYFLAMELWKVKIDLRYYKSMYEIKKEYADGIWEIVQDVLDAQKDKE